MAASSTTETQGTAPGATSVQPANPALDEPDAMAIVQKGQSISPAVSYDRKLQLLLQARADRRQWVQQVPLPYASARDPNNVWSMEDQLQPFHTSLACKRAPAITKVLSELYGLESNARAPDEVAQRVGTLIQPFLKNTTTNIAGVETEGEDVLASALAEANGVQKQMLQAYYQFWTTLLKPECALLVQGMRNFLGNLQDATMERLSGAIKSYVDSTVESTLKSHPAWRGQDLSQVKRSLESFLYGQAQPLLDRLEWTGLFVMLEDEWMTRLTQLQFLQPTHLEIQCLNETAEAIDELLQEPVQAMLSIDQYYSPYEKLQRILLVYQSVNGALSSALNGNQTNPTANRKLPSADDVLPTIILTVLRAKPHRLLRNLQMIENFAPAEYLRGEAGYAFTNLYGAVQFLQDLNMDKPESLSIAPEDFRKGLEESVIKTQERFSIGIQGPVDYLDKNDPGFVPNIHVRDVRQARLNGEVINLEWAIQYQKEHPEKYGMDDTMDAMTDSAPLPLGFSRSYGFLSSTPHDIRLSDLPKLLAEYKMLVHVSEQLLGERGARMAQDKKNKDTQKKRQLDDSFFGIHNSSEQRERALTS